MLTVIYLMLVLVVVLVAVSFYTLFERKILSLSHIRQGPVVVSMLGLLQPFSDAVKLFSKEIVTPFNSNHLIYILMPTASVLASLGCWVVLPYSSGLMSMKFVIFLFFILTGVGVYAHLGAGWASNSNYALIGALRSVAQSVSYEVSFAFMLIMFILALGEYNLSLLFNTQEDLVLAISVPVMASMWLISCLAETNRAPFDFAEGESELVSGFNVEYGSTGFAMLFIGEYASMIFMSFLFGVVFFGGSTMAGGGGLCGLGVMYLFVWVRVALPRSRYDKLMGLFWFSMLPMAMVIILIIMVAY